MTDQNGTVESVRSVTTLLGARYTLGLELGRGGQGAVYSVPNMRIAVKLVFDKSPAARERLRDQLAMVARLPLDGLAIARPLEQLRPPHVGYVMELLSDMEPLAALGRPPKDGPSVSEWYLRSGGLRRRLRLLAGTAEVLSKIHGRGLTYVDLSPNNVFVSTDTAVSEVRLIDTDNLRHCNSTARCLFTPGYGAPEIVSGKGVPSTLSDAHAFAVLAFETLTLTHPLIGDWVRDGEPELEEQAFLGRLPWIEHPSDDRNRASDGIPRTMVLSKALLEDFQATFGPGLREPDARPGLAQWAEHLERASGRTLTCPECKSTYFFDQECCPWCDAERPTFVAVAVLLWRPTLAHPSQGGDSGGQGAYVPGVEGRPRVADVVALDDGESVELPARLVLGDPGTGPHVRLRWKGRRLSIQSDTPEEITLSTVDESKLRRLPKGEVELTLREGRCDWLVHLGPMSRPHRVLRFDLRRGANR